MDVYLLPKRDGTHTLYASGLGRERADAPDPEASTVRKFLQAARGAYETITRRRHQREQLLENLGDLDHIRVFYPSSMNGSEARRIYDDMLQSAIEKHRKWMLVDAAAVPVAVPLTLIPGPNVLLGYLAWRSVTHYKTKKASERATEIAIELVPSTTLSQLAELVRQRIALRRRQRIRALGEGLGLEALEREY